MGWKKIYYEDQGLALRGLFLTILFSSVLVKKCAYLEHCFKDPHHLILFQEYMLMSHEVTCMLTFGDNLLLTGCANGNIIQWDIEKSQVDKV